MKRNQLHAAGALLALAVIFSCPPDRVFAQAPPASAQPARPATYVLQPGDELEIRAFNIPELTQTARIRPDGKISLVLLNDIDAAGRTTEQLNEQLCSLYGKHFRNPQVTTIVRTFSGFNVYVGGEVAQPGLVPLGGDLTAVSAIFRAGGFKDTAAPKRIVLLRNGADGSPVVINLDADEILTKGRPDSPLKAGDVLFVPKSAINIYVGGEVIEPGLIPLDGQLTALAAVIKAKGFKPTAKLNSVMLIRDSGQGKPIITKVNLSEVLAQKQPDTPLKPFDVVYVPKSTIAKIDQFMEQYVRQVQPISVVAGFSYLLGTGLF